MRRMWAVAVAAVLASGCKPPPELPPVAAPAIVAVTPTPASDEAPPTMNGVVVIIGGCPGEGCYFGRMQATGSFDLYQEPAGSPVVVGQVSAGEWLDTVTTQERVALLRGLKHEAGDPAGKRSVVYRMSNEGEGCFGTWENGKTGSWCDDGSEDAGRITWDAAPGRTDGSEGLWVQVKRAAGPGGWLREPKDVRCIGYQDRDADCPPLPR